MGEAAIPPSLSETSFHEGKRQLSLEGRCVAVFDPPFDLATSMRRQGASRPNKREEKILDKEAPARSP